MQIQLSSALWVEMSLALEFHGHVYTDSAASEPSETAGQLQVAEFGIFVTNLKKKNNHYLQLQINGLQLDLTFFPLGKDGK